MSRDDILKELMERRVRRQADELEVEVRSVQGLARLELLAAAWRDAQDDAAAAYKLWSRSAGPDAYAIYRAAQDRADEAQDALWQQHILTDGAPGYEGWVVS
jgi:hypothetical protein